MNNFKEIDAKLATLAQVRFRYDIINPTNSDEEYEKFLAANGNYNPQFIYNTFDNTFDAQPYIEQLKALAIPTDTTLGKALAQVRDDLLEEARALANIGTDNFVVEDAYGELSKEELAKVHEILKQGATNTTPNAATATTEQTYPATELGRRIEEKLRSYKLHGWSIIYSEDALSRTAITKDTKTITIKADEEFSEKDIKKLLVHEIETHVLRWYNGTQQEYNIFAIGTHDYLATEEGLAGYNESVEDVASANPEFNVAVIALATHLGKTQGFTEVYKVIRKYHEDDEGAFRIVTRVKRGLGDTSKPGGYLKDHAYFRGMLQIEEFIKAGGNIRQLYAGKISIKDIALFDEGVLKPVNTIPEFVK